MGVRRAADEAMCVVYTRVECARKLGCSERTISRWEEKGRFPRHLDVPGVVVYLRVEVDSWLGDRTRRVG